MRIVMLVNSAASSVTGRRRVVIHKALSADHDVTTIETVRRGHATRLARAAASQNADLVVVLGGDGTLNEAANGLAGTDTALAALPGGSTNVFARIIGVPDDPVEAVGQLLDALDRDAVADIGLGMADGRYFLFHCGIGFDAAVVELVESRGPWKRWAGHPLFIYAAITTWAQRAIRHGAPMRLLDSDGSAFAEGRMTIVLNANPYTYLAGRGLDLLGAMSLNEPLAAVTLKSLSLRRMLPVAVRAIGSGDVRGIAGTSVNTGLCDFTVRAEPSIPYQLDGDHMGSSPRLHIRWTPDALRLLLP